jgi:APA family basic amino acid/polyamine antiporter
VTAELASTLPEAGGVYAFLREAFGPWLGFLWGWAMFWTMHSGIIAAIATVFARYLGYFVALGDAGTKVAGVGAVLVLSAINYVGVRQGSVLQTVFTAGKLLAIIAIILVGLLFGAEAHVGATAVQPTEAVVRAWGAGDFALALVAGLFAFGGWHMVTYNAEETHDPRRTIPRALVIGVLVVTACYVALNAVYLYLLPMEAVASSDRVAADAADAVFGRGGGSAMSALVVFSTFGALSGIVLAGPRVYYAMARDGVLFRWAGAVHPRYHTPHRAIVLQALWSSVLVATGTYRVLFTRVVYTEWIFFGLMAVGLVLLRRRRDLSREYSVWGYPWVPAIFAMSAFAIVANQIASDPGESMVGLGLVLVGLPVYHFWARRGHRAHPRTSVEIPEPTNE